MLETTCINAIEGWITSCQEWVPLEVTNDHPCRESLAKLIASNSQLRGSRIEALLGLRIGFIDRAHEIVQHGTTSMDRYLHGVVHRIEGDFWNAKYWFRQVDGSELLASIGHEVSISLQSLNMLESLQPIKLFDEQNRFAAESLVDAQTALCQKSNSDERATIQQIAHAEWNALWKIAKLENCS